jgi:hypothetical protein
MSSIYKELFVGKPIKVATDLAEKRGDQYLWLAKDDVTNLPPKPDPKRERVIMVGAPASFIMKIYVES